MDETRLFETLDECDRLTADAFAGWKAATDARLAEQFGCAVGELRPWHYEDPFFQEVPAAGGVDLDGRVRGQGRRGARACARTTASASTRMPSSTAATSSRATASASTRSASTSTARATSACSRTLPTTATGPTRCSTSSGTVRTTSGFDRALPWLLRDCHLTVTEGIAILMGRLAQDAEWLREVAGLDSADVERLEAGLRAAQAAELLVFTRWVLVMTNFERALYADPEADLDAVWWRLVSRYQLVTPPDGRNAPDWAAKIHVACAPVYYHTYLYGNLVASQLRATARPRRGRARRPARGGRIPGRAGVPPGPVAALGPADRGDNRRAAHRDARRAGHRGRSRDLRESSS